MSMEKNYNPQESEEKIYRFWQQNKCFSGTVDKTKKPFTLVMPPPNITGNLHMGHALDQTLQDIIIRFKRMQGYSTLWVPGTDHASIATEAKICQQLRKEGTSKEEIGREEFLKRAWEWKKNYGGNITKQLKKLGVSCDWEKERFTLDEGCSEAVKEFFVRLYEKGLIYRGERVIHWCPKCRTSISDSEVDFKEQDGNFWHVKYKVCDSSEEVVVATTRPETIFGDVALAVNPEDERYKHLIGKEVVVPLVGRVVPVVADSYVDITLGTGVLKITPAHDPNDFEVGMRHNLPIINVMDETAHMNENALDLNGLDRYEARKEVVNRLKSNGYLSKCESIKHSVGTCYRCSETIEPRISKQWFVKMKSLAERGMENVKAGNIEFIPDRFKKVYYHWMENIKDWCISRQLWWGHRIPVWYCKDCGKIIVSKEDVSVCPKCSSKNIEPELDTLDTWFSSALWPFSVLGWPKKTPELDYFFPADVLVTGYDLIFFWISRMIFSSLEMTDKVPFSRILIHGLVRDAQGRKMSKSLGNGIDPIEVIQKYGADALRFSLVLGNSPGNDFRISEEKLEAGRNFANKIWNAARFVKMKVSNIEGSEKTYEPTLVDKWIVARLNKVIEEVTFNLEKLELGLAAQKLYDFIWDEFCDWYLEFSKLLNNHEILAYILKSILKLIHPFMPFLTEQIWGYFSENEDSIMMLEYPKSDSEKIDEKSEQDVQVLITTIKTIRNMRRELSVPQGKKVSVFIESAQECHAELLKNYSEMICKLAGCEQVQFSGLESGLKCKTSVDEYSKIYIPLAQLIDKDLELSKLNKQLDDLNKQLEGVIKRLSDNNFMSKAPAKIIEGAKDMERKLRSKIENTKESILEIKNL